MGVGEKNLYFFFMLFLPLLNYLCVVDTKIIDDKKYFLVRIFYKSLEKYFEEICIHSAFVSHISEFSLIGKR